MYSQNKEEETITTYFSGTTGRFLDIGAWDGKTFSNSLRLVELGWSGVCVEPAPASYARLKELHKDNERVECLEVAISDSNGTLKFYETTDDALSTSELAHIEKWKSWGAKFIPIEVNCVDFETLLAKIGYDFDFINIDTESTNLKLIKLLPLAKLPKLKLLCIEHDSHFSEITKIMSPHGFREISRNGENLIFAR